MFVGIKPPMGRLLKTVRLVVPNAVTMQEQLLLYQGGKMETVLADKVFVYGTLKENYSLNGVMNSCGSKKLKVAKVPGFTLVELGWFPGAVKNENSYIEGEVWSTSPELLNRLDMIEGVNSGLYTRELVETDEKEKVWIYLYGNQDLEYFQSFNRIIGPKWPCEHSTIDTTN